MDKIKAFYVWDENLITQCDRLPAVVGRATMVHDLILEYGLLDQIKVVRSSPASYNELKNFHSDLYLDHLKTFIDIDDEYMSNTQDEEYGIGYDCPPVSNMFDLVSTIAGGSITAAKCLTLGIADVAINWCGGWHHAHRFGAEGFCYVNDIVLSIEKLRKKFPKVLYIDLDVHHGNGVQDAFSLSKSVFTLSFHKYEPGFYPGTGGIEDIGTLAGAGYTCNFPLHGSYSDKTMEYIFEKVLNAVWSHFGPDAVVLQCGADALAHDPHGRASVTPRGYGACVRRVLDKRKPTVMLGGGGYKHPNAARLWASLTALVAGVTLDVNIPEHSHWPQYGPDYTVNVDPTLAKDTNQITYLDECVATIIGNLQKYLPINEIREPDPKRKMIDETTPMRENAKLNDYVSMNAVKELNNISEDNKQLKTKRIKILYEDKIAESADVYTFVDE